MAQLQFLSPKEAIVTRTIAASNASGRKYGNYINIGFFFLELLVLNACFLLSAWITAGDSMLRLSSEGYVFFAAYNVAWMAFTLVFDRQHIKRNFNLSSAFFSSIKVVLLHFLLITTLIQFVNIFNMEQGHYLMNYIMLVTALPATRITALYALSQYRKLGYNFRNVVIIGSGSTALKMHQFIEGDPSLGLKFKGFFDDSPESPLSMNLLKGKVQDFYEYCQKNDINEVFCALPPSQSDTISELIEFADNNLVRFRLLPDFGKDLNKKVEMSFYGSIPVLTPRHEPLEILSNRLVKRMFDVCFSLAVIVFLFPFLFPVIALLIRLSSKGPTFFKQLRSGKDNKGFYCYKFRTMKVNKDSDKMQATKGDNRVTRIGEFLRKSSLDELPQFFNVLKGEMSVVGPRPHMLLHTEQYSKIIDSYMVRHLVKPGITGWAQINGYRGNTSDPELMRKRVEHDMLYLENWSIWLDIKIVFLTVWNVVKGEENAF